MSEGLSRRTFLCSVVGCAAAAATSGCGDITHTSWYRKNFRELSRSEVDEIIRGLEAEHSKTYGKSVSVSTQGPIPGTEFGYALDLSRCIGCRRCVYGCAEENNSSRDPQVHWIRVLRMERERGIDLHESDAYYDSEKVPEPGYSYVPIACQQCRNAPCVKSCPVEATWQEADGIVVVDYDWCIGCRCCISACPYGARHFNWGQPEVPAEEMNPKTHYLGNRPRPKGVVEKCTFCIHRVREGRYPRCVEVCPVGARKFGNLLDPESEVRRILDQKRVVVLKNELNTRPRFYYFFG